MNRIVIHSRVGADGVLQIAVPLGAAEAEREVEVTIDVAAAKSRPDNEPSDWPHFVGETAGAWQGEFVRPTQGDYEVRDKIP